MPNMIVTTDKLPYGKSVYKRNDILMVSERDADLLNKIGRAAFLPDLHDPVMVDVDAPAKAAVSEPLADEDRSVPRYLTRHMVADDDAQKKSGRPRGRPRKLQSSLPDQASSTADSTSSGDDLA